MLVLIDECLPRRLAAALVGHEATTVPDAGWAGKSNGELLELAEGQYEAFLTIDRNLVREQDLEGRRLGVILITAFSNRFDAISPLLPHILDALERIRPGLLIRIGG